MDPSGLCSLLGTRAQTEEGQKKGNRALVWGMSVPATSLKVVFCQGGEKHKDWELKYNGRGEKEIITVIFPLGGLI